MRWPENRNPNTDPYSTSSQSLTLNMSSNGEERLIKGELDVSSMSSPEMKRKRKTTPPTITKKKKKPSTTPQSSPIPSLPYDLVLNIVARVPRLYHPTLSLVSKSFRSLLASPELYKVRSLIGNIESCLYVCINWFPEGFRWFTLCRKPDQTLTSDEKKKSSGYVLASVPMTNTPRANFASVVALGSDIYNIGVPQSFREPPPLASLFWIAGLTLGARLQVCLWSYLLFLLASLMERRFMLQDFAMPIPRTRTHSRCSTPKHKLGILCPSLAVSHSACFTVTAHVLTESYMWRLKI